MSSTLTQSALRSALEVLDPEPDLFWAHGDEVIAAWGQVAEVLMGAGEDRIDRARRELEARFSELDGAVDPIAYGSFTFDPRREGSALVVPRFVLRIRGGGTTLTDQLGGTPRMPEPRALRRLEEIRYGGSSLPDHLWLERVAQARRAIRAGGLRKVVLARDVKVWSKESIDQRTVLERLAERFPGCYTFACRGLVGATPELLVSRDGTRARSLILAGSAPRGEGPEDERLGLALLGSAKDGEEHQHSVDSVVGALDGVARRVEVGEPRLLRLPNVQHLATDFEAEVGDVSVLELVARLHPTAAVCGTPRATAAASIAELEDLDRGRYAGPVGWVDAKGNGEWGIALRCAQLSGSRGRLFAGAGIVASSEPEAELEETRIKLQAMMSVLGPR